MRGIRLEWTFKLCNESKRFLSEKLKITPNYCKFQNKVAIYNLIFNSEYRANLRMMQLLKQDKLHLIFKATRLWAISNLNNYLFF